MLEASMAIWYGYGMLWYRHKEHTSSVMWCAIFDCLLAVYQVKVTTFLVRDCKKQVPTQSI